ncbi:hypothetical protein GCM10010151_32260 [Actinoallomurus spadix]|uniref:Uncharacterized protein n=1 Tax=Actinoallomurus spadix TaxID=79912 RepID=A0ABP3G9N6_9ACTN
MQASEFPTWHRKGHAPLFSPNNGIWARATPGTAAGGREVTAPAGTGAVTSPSGHPLVGKPRFTPPWEGSSHREVTTFPRV